MFIKVSPKASSAPTPAPPSDGNVFVLTSGNGAEFVHTIPFAPTSGEKVLPFLDAVQLSAGK